MNVTLKIRSEMRIPAGKIGQIDVSIPRGGRLFALSGWAAADVADLCDVLPRLGWEVSSRPADELRPLAADLHRKLRSIDTDAVWLVPSAVGAKVTYEQHLAPFCRPPAQALIAAGLRDVFQNTYKWLYTGGAQPALYCRATEPLRRRNYTVLYQLADEPWRLRGGTATVVARRPVIEGDAREVRFAIAATPLVEAGQPVDDARRVGNQSDLRHEFRLGNNVALLRQLQALLLPEGDAEVSGRRVIAEARRLGLADEDGYFLSGIGVSADGDVILLSDHCGVRELARQLCDAGAEYAVLTEEGGSCATVLQQVERDFRPGGGLRLGPDGQPVWGAPVRFGNNSYHRDQALAALILQLTGVVLEKPFCA